MKKLQPKVSLINSIKKLIEETKTKVVRNVNSIIVHTYLEIGRRMVAGG